MPAIIVPATPVKAVFMNALREHGLSPGSIMGYRLYEVSMCLEWESVPPGNQRVPDRDFVNVAPLQLGKEIAFTH
jgi:hypothetical protein